LSSLSRCMKIGMWSDALSQMEISDLAKWTVRPRLMSISGVANVAIWGERDPQLQVLVDPNRLHAHGVTLDQVQAVVRDATSPGAGGFIDTPNQRLAIRHIPPVYTPDELGQTVVTYQQGNPILLNDLAEVTIDHATPIGDAIINSQPGLLLIVEKQPWANTLEVTRAVEAAMQELRPALTGAEFDTTIFRPATFIERSIANLTHSMLFGCVLVLIVLILFLYDWRSALISAVAIPLSLIAALMILYWRGGTVNTMVLAGLVIALGEVVDDAIIDVENIVRRLRLNQQLGENRQSAFQVVLSASLEVRSAVVYATAIVILAFMPVFFLQGLAGSFFRPLASAYVLAILASLGTALTVTPALAYLLLPAGAELQHREAPTVVACRALYRRLLRTCLAHQKLTVIATLIAVLAIAATIPGLGEELMPKFKETDFLMHWVEKPGIGIDAMDRITVRASEELMKIDGVRNFGSHIGRAEVADEVVGPNFTELWISIDPSVDYHTTVAQVQATVDGYPGLYRDLLTYLAERVKEVLTGTSSSIVVRVFGPDMDQLRTSAGQIAESIQDIEGVTTLKVEPQVLVPQITIKLRPDAAARFGLTPGVIMRQVNSLVNGTVVGEIYRDQKVVQVAVRGEPQLRADVPALRNLFIDTPSGAQVPLSDLADIAIVPSPNEIKREGASRRLDVTCNVEGRDLGSVAREIEANVLGNVSFPNGYHPEFLGEYAETRASQQRMLLTSIAAIAGILIVLYVDFRSWNCVIRMALTIPLSLLGGIVGTYACGGTVSLGSLVGFVTVLGIAARTSIMLVSHYRHLHNEEGLAWNDDLIVRGAEERLSPILMTALTTGLALLPIVVTGNLPGQEIEYPMAFVILGGLVVSGWLNLFLLPVLFRHQVVSAVSE
ncbi:MAG: efflux RND transporter permease subunit, partial [Planctomycetales bacterium]|nr:efflux RND transporter permease subunit [Planctomycetales bacterium]